MLNFLQKKVSNIILTISSDIVSSFIVLVSIFSGNIGNLKEIQYKNNCGNLGQRSFFA